MKRLFGISILLINLFVFIGCSTTSISGSGHLVEEAREVTEFNKLEISGSFDVEITLGEQTKVLVFADDNHLPYITTEVVSGTLYVKAKERLRSTDDSKIVINVPNLESIVASGSNSVVAKNFQNEKLILDLNGSTDIEVVGTTDLLELEGNGSIDVNAVEMISGIVNVEVRGSADIMVQAIKELNIDASGSVSVRYTGNPSIITQDVAGSASISHF